MELTQIWPGVLAQARSCTNRSPLLRRPAWEHRLAVTPSSSRQDVYPFQERECKGVAYREAPELPWALYPWPGCGLMLLPPYFLHSTFDSFLALAEGLFTWSSRWGCCVNSGALLASAASSCLLGASINPPCRSQCRSGKAGVVLGLINMLTCMWMFADCIPTHIPQY